MTVLSIGNSPDLPHELVFRRAVTDCSSDVTRVVAGVAGRSVDAHPSAVRLVAGAVEGELVALSTKPEAVVFDGDLNGVVDLGVDLLPRALGETSSNWPD